MTGVDRTDSSKKTKDINNSTVSGVAGLSIVRDVRFEVVGGITAALFKFTCASDGYWRRKRAR